MKGLRVKAGTGLVVGLVLCVVGVGAARASLGISLTGDPTINWSLSNISPESVNESDTVWTVENTGSEAEDISISAAGETEGWTAVDEISDIDQFILKHNAYGTYKPITDTISLTDNLPWETGPDTKNFHLQFTAPKSGSVSPQDITVTLTANNQWYSGPIALDVVPNKGIKPNISGINIDGDHFESGATVWLKKDDTEIQATSTTFNSSESLTADFTFGGADPTGGYTIEVVNPTGDTSPPKMQDGTDCFFGAATDDAINWTTDAGHIQDGVKAGSSDLTTLEGTAMVVVRTSCRPPVGALTYSSCTVACSGYPPRCYAEYYLPRIGGGKMDSRGTYTNRWCECLGHSPNSVKSSENENENATGYLTTEDCLKGASEQVRAPIRLQCWE